MRSIELFAGGGGLALGTAAAGFTTEAVIEWDRHSCRTLKQNANAGHPLADWKVTEGDVRHVDWDEYGGVDLVSGGPPCQPFSAGGKAMAADDPRDMFPAATEAIRAIKPKAFILENVRGLTRPSLSNYFHYIQLRLAHPEIVGATDESWENHYARLQSEETAGVHSDLQYRVIPTLVNAADYGVPQHRHRVFIVGFRADIRAEWSFPTATHSGEALLWSQHRTGEYWESNGLQRSAPDERTRKQAERLSGRPSCAPWRTVRQALADLPEPQCTEDDRFMDHVFQPGAKSYPGHTGSIWDAPSKALKAGVHGVPGGENMLRHADGTVRYFTVREAARLQTFPDDWQLHGPWGEVMRQIGNAVPMQLASIVANSVHQHLEYALPKLRSVS